MISFLESSPHQPINASYLPNNLLMRNASQKNIFIDDRDYFDFLDNI